MGSTKSKASIVSRPVANDSPTAPGLQMLGPANFTTFQLPNSNSNAITANLSGLQECIGYVVGSDLLNNCISSNIKGLDKSSNSYQNIKYIGPGHSINKNGDVSFGQLVQSFQNMNSNDTITNNTLVIYIIIVILYLFIMLK
jgi:hypothetical protein